MLSPHARSLQQPPLASRLDPAGDAPFLPVESPADEESLAALFGGIAIEARGLPIPVAPTGNWAEGSGVVLMLGNDSAGKTLAEVGGAPVTGVTVAATTSTTA